MKYNDKIRVTSGFYEGMEGNVIRENISMVTPYLTSSTHLTFSEKEVSYKCLLRNHLDEVESDYIHESSLELIESPKDKEIKKISEQLQNELTSSLELIK